MGIQAAMRMRTDITTPGHAAPPMSPRRMSWASALVKKDAPAILFCVMMGKSKLNNLTPGRSRENAINPVKGCACDIRI